MTKNLVPFPHILETPSWRNNGKMRVVSDIPVDPGNVLICADRKMAYLVEFVTGQRPARGDWSGYPAHPTYYECLASIFKDEQTPESNESGSTKT